MLNDQGVIPTLTSGARPCGSHFPFGMGRLAAVFRRALVARVLWARTPIRRYAGLWEASLWMDRSHLGDGACFEPDPFASESPFPRDRWPFLW